MLWYHVYVYYNQRKLHELLLIGCSENRLWTMCSINILLQNRSALFNLQLTCSARFWWIRCRVWRFAFMHAYPSNMVLKIITKVVIFLSFRSFFKISNGSFCLPAPLPLGGGGEEGAQTKYNASINAIQYEKDFHCIQFNFSFFRLHILYGKENYSMVGAVFFQTLFANSKFNLFWWKFVHFLFKTITKITYYQLSRNWYSQNQLLI